MAIKQGHDKNNSHIANPATAKNHILFNIPHLSAQTTQQYTNVWYLFVSIFIHITVLLPEKYILWPKNRIKQHESNNDKNKQQPTMYATQRLQQKKSCADSILTRKS